MDRTELSDFQKECIDNEFEYTLALLENTQALITSLPSFDDRDPKVQDKIIVDTAYVKNYKLVKRYVKEKNDGHWIITPHILKLARELCEDYVKLPDKEMALTNLVLLRGLVSKDSKISMDAIGKLLMSKNKTSS